MLNESVSAAIRNRWLVLFTSILLGGLGIFSFTQMNIDAYPDISGVQVQITTAYPGRAAEEVEQQITIPLEKTFASIPRHEVIRSRSIFGLSLVQIIFEPDVDDYWAREVVFQKMGEAGLPADAESSMAPLATGYGEIYRYEIKGGAEYGPLELRELNDWVITPRLLKAKGVAEVQNFGGLGKQYIIQLDPNKLLQYGVKLQDLEAAIKANNSSGGGSFLERGSTSLVIRGLGRINNYMELENVFVKNSSGTKVFIRDLGHIVTGSLPQTGIFGKDDNGNTVEGLVRMRRGENPSEVLKNIKEAVADLNSYLLPKGVRIDPFYDRTVMISQTLHTVFHNTAMGIILVVIMLFIFLGNSRIALIVALTIPASLLFAFILMKLTGIPISLLSVGAIDFGIIVDGAIIVSENIIRHLSEKRSAGRSFRDIILEASHQVQKPMLFSMLIVIIAYFPLLSLQYIEGLLFRPMAITLCFALLGALLIALYLVPVLSTFLFRKKVSVNENNIFNLLTEKYRELLIKILFFRRRIIAVFGAVFAAVLIIILPHLGTEFLPYMDEGNFWIRANFPEGISLKENSHYGDQMRKILHEFQEVDFVTSQTGRTDSGTDPFPTNRIEMMIGLKDRSHWKNYHKKLELEAAIQRRLSDQFPTTRFNLTQPIIDMVIEDANGTSADLAVEIAGDNLELLRGFAEKTAGMLKKIPGSVNVGIEQEGPQPQLQIRIDKTKLAHYQLAVDAVNDVINTAVGGLPISQIYEGERRFDIVAKYAPEFVSTPEQISILPVFNDQGEAIPLAQVANISVRDGQTLIAREGGKRRVTIRCDIRGRAQGTFVTDAKKHFLKEIRLPDGYRVQWLGMFENLERARKHFSLLIPLIFGIIFSLLFIAFKSLREAIVVFLTVPFSMIGSLLALWIRGMHISVSAGVGLTSLFGVAVMHGVIMVTYIQQLRSERESIDDAIIDGASLRLRPILMTASVAIIGLFPASLATGIGSDVQRPIATVIVWGLVSSVFLTLFALPAFYKIIVHEKQD